MASLYRHAGIRLWSNDAFTVDTILPNFTFASYRQLSWFGRHIHCLLDVCNIILPQETWHSLWDHQLWVVSRRCGLTNHAIPALQEHRICVDYESRWFHVLGALCHFMCPHKIPSSTQTPTFRSI